MEPPPQQTPETKVLVANLPGGGEVAYLDSGPVPNSDNFSTLILVHGMHFNAYGFEHLLPSAHKFNIRLVLPQRRDYAGSSKYTDSEITAITENPQLFFEGAGRTLSQFVLYLIENTHVCKPSEDYSKGGIGVGGWSFGATSVLAMFSRREMLEDSTYSVIKSYLTALIFYDPPHNVFGIRLPVEPSSSDTGFDNELFRLAVSSYYDQPAEWDGRLSTLDRRDRTDHCIWESWAPSQKRRWTEDFPMRSDLLVLMHALTPPYLEKLSREVLFDFNSDSSSFPRARVTYLHGKRSLWHCVVSRYQFRNKQVASLKQGQGANLRPVHLEDMERGNHFIHFDYPQEFMTIMRQCLSQEP